MVKSNSTPSGTTFKITHPRPRKDQHRLNLDAQHVRAAISELRDLLDRGAPEESVHQLLAAHIEFWNGIVRLSGGCPLYSKIRFSGDFVLDFAYVDMSSNGAEWHFVEIEGPRWHLFTKAGDPTAHLTHALRQVRDWQYWVSSNPNYARQTFPGVLAPMGHVFMGRRSELATEAARDRLHALNIENRSHVEIHTLDRFLEMAGTSLNFGHTYLPHEALTDSDLREKGLPSFLKRWIKSDFGSQTLFLEERPYRDRFDEDFGLGDESDITTVTPGDIEVVHGGRSSNPQRQAGVGTTRLENPSDG